MVPIFIAVVVGIASVAGTSKVSQPPTFRDQRVPLTAPAKATFKKKEAKQEILPCQPVEGGILPIEAAELPPPAPALPQQQAAAAPAPEKPAPAQRQEEPQQLPPQQASATSEKPPAPVTERRPTIAVIIDDMGMDSRQSLRAVRLPPAVTLAYLPYSPRVAEQTLAAQASGHELLLHLPMESDSGAVDEGPDYLGAGMAPLDIHARLEKNLGAFKGYVGVNNHMGSRFTRDAEAMNIVMAALAERRLMFLDSLTTPGSVGEKTAQAHKVQATHRDVFLDNDGRPVAIAAALAEVEAIARRTGSAVAIGHPRDNTLAALEAWLPALAEKGFELVPVTEIANIREKRRASLASAQAASAALPQ